MLNFKREFDLENRKDFVLSYKDFEGVAVNNYCNCCNKYFQSGRYANYSNYAEHEAELVDFLNEEDVILCEECYLELETICNIEPPTNQMDISSFLEL